MHASALFQPFQLKAMSLKNRIVMAPMTRSKSPGGVAGPDVAGTYTVTYGNGNATCTIYADQAAAGNYAAGHAQQTGYVLH